AVHLSPAHRHPGDDRRRRRQAAGGVQRRLRPHRLLPQPAVVLRRGRPVLAQDGGRLFPRLCRLVLELFRRLYRQAAQDRLGHLCLADRDLRQPKPALVAVRALRAAWGAGSGASRHTVFFGWGRWRCSAPPPRMPRTAPISASTSMPAATPPASAILPSPRTASRSSRPPTTRPSASGTGKAASRCAPSAASWVRAPTARSMRSPCP